MFYDPTMLNVFTKTFGYIMDSSLRVNVSIPFVVLGVGVTKITKEESNHTTEATGITRPCAIDLCKLPAKDKSQKLQPQ